MKLLLLLLLLSLVPVSIYADLFDERNYEEGPLTWYDFQGEPKESDEVTGQINYLLEYHQDEDTRNDTTFTYIKTSNYFNKNDAWASDKNRTSIALRYFQVLFDIREYYRRQLEKELNQSTNFYNMGKKHIAFFEKGSMEIQLFQKDSDYGNKRDVLLRWEAEYATKLNEYKPFELPMVKNANWMFGGNIGLVTSFNTGTMNEFITESYGLTYGFDLGYRDFIMFFEASLVYGDVREPFTYEKTWETGTGVNLAIGDISLGYPIYENSNHRITPFFGLGVHEIGASKSAKELEGINITNFNYLYGLCYDFNLSTTVNIIPDHIFGGANQSNHQSLRLRLFVTDVRNDIFKGNSINLSLAYSFYSKMVDIIE